MSTELPKNELSEFHVYIGRRLENGGRDLTPEESVQEYRAYQNEVKRLHERIQSSIDSGEAKPLDSEALMNEVRAELAEEGITD